MAFPYPGNVEKSPPVRRQGPAPRYQPKPPPIRSEAVQPMGEVNSRSPTGYLPERLLTNYDTLENYVLLNENRWAELERQLVRQPTYDLFNEYELLVTGNELLYLDEFAAGVPAYEEELAHFLQRVERPAGRRGGEIAAPSRYVPPARPATAATGSAGNRNLGSITQSPPDYLPYLQIDWLQIIGSALATFSENATPDELAQLEQKTGEAIELLTEQLRNNPDAFTLLRPLIRLYLHARLLQDPELYKKMYEPTSALYHDLEGLELVWQRRALLRYLDTINAHDRPALLAQLEGFQDDRLIQAELARLNRPVGQAVWTNAGGTRVRRIGGARR